jgi:eukaryotic-like serine/threonine-protein kinase
MRLEEGQVVDGRYRLIGRLGSGGMADVWLAQDQMLDREVALKFLHERFAQDEQFVERFRREAQAAAGLQHANVVGVYDRGEWEGRHWIAMEYVEGASLKDLIQRGLEIGEALEIIRQILAGARFAHERGIIHRDLKPHNVLVDAEGRARVADFGIARAGASEITQTGSVLGTAQYLSPEQAQGMETTAASDLYSIGVILYEALTGRVPFEGDSPVAVALKQVSEQPRPPSELNPNVSPALDAVVLKALAKDPADRFTSAQEFIHALDAAEADPSGGALGDTATYGAVAAAGAGALAGAAAATTLSPEEAAAAERAAETGEHPTTAGWMTRRRAVILGAIALVAAGLAIFALTRPEKVTVPTVIGDSLSTAQGKLDNRGFDVNTRFVPSCNQANTVTEQDPPSGSEADEGSTVTLTVSQGLSVRVPNVRGDEAGKATAAVEREQLLVEERQRPSSNVKAGRVIDTEPAPGTEVDCQSTVTLVVSRGANLVTLPDVLGLQRAEAESQLEALGLIVNIETEDADEPEGTVIGEDPGPGSRLEKGTRVTLTVSTGAGSVVVPNVEGQPESTAISILQGEGLTNIKVVRQTTDDESDDGRVTDQAPPAGTRQPAGRRVTIFVGKFVEPPPEPEPEPPTTTTPTTPTP